MCNKQTPLQNLLTEKEIAARLKVRRETLSRLRRAGTNPLPSLRLGTARNARLRYDWDAVIDWMTRNGRSLGPHACPGVDANASRDGGLQ